MNVGDIFVKDGKRYRILALLGGENYSLQELKGEPKEEPKAEPEETPVIAEKRRRRKKV
jgi:hypothetical protein